MKITDVLNKIEIYISERIERPNAGGCGCIAVYVARELILRNISFEFHFDLMGEYDSPFDDLYHIWIRTDNYHFNRGRFSTDTILNEDSLKELEECVRKRSKWNRIYKRTQNPKLKKAIKYYFNKYDNGKKN